MNYTTLTRVKTALGAEATTSDPHLESIIASASRLIDRHCSGKVGLDDYLALSTVADEQGQARASGDGSILYPVRKVLVQSVSSFAFRPTPLTDWQSINPQHITFDGYMVKAWGENRRAPGNVFVKISYAGGLAGTTADLPADILDAADILAVRLFKEIKSGLGDTIGVAELGTMQYTKALRARVVEMVKPYKTMIA